MFLSDFIMVYVTTANKIEAEKIARALLEECLVACVNVFGPVSSYFHWEGKIDLAEEYLLIMKTEDRLFVDLERCVRALHSYEVPEILAVPIVGGCQRYFDWMIGTLTR
jgi:periplasmic divalent cation tolerance protein